MAEHYFRVANIPVKPKSLIRSFLSNLSVTGWLITVNVFIFFLTFFLGMFFNVGDYLAIQANNFFNNYYFWTILTSMFMHASLLHLLANMFSLYFIGRFLETLIGKKRFFWLYLISGIFAGLLFISFAFLFGNTELGSRLFGTMSTSAVGASGAIFGIAGVLAFLTPRSKVYLLFGPVVAIIFQAVINNFISSPALLNLISIIITLYIFVCIFSMFSFGSISKTALPLGIPLWVIPFIAIVPFMVVDLFLPAGKGTGMGNMGHLGGFIAGAIYGLYLRIKYPKKTEMISRRFSQ